MSLRIVDPGVQSSVQDLGRPGYSHLGVPSSGAADVLSLTIGNRLVGNEDSAAGIETAMRHCRVEFERDVTFCITGSVAGAQLTEGGRSRAIDPYRAIDAGQGARLDITLAPRLMRSYLCVAGGINTAAILGSRSAYLPAPLGPYAGALRAGDVLPLGARGPLATSRPCRSLVPLIEASASHAVLRIIRSPGAQANQLLKVSFRVLPQSNRMGVRLKGPSVAFSAGHSGISEGTTAGSIQLPTDSEPIILGVDRPTTGGYPIVATVIAADLPIVGQLAPGTEIRFEEVGLDEALDIARRQRAMLDDTLPAPREPNRAVDLNCDLGEGMPQDLDEALMRLVTSVSIACGGHAGDEATMERTVRAAMKHGCRIGAHPSFPDRANFGRRMLSISSEDLERSLAEQITTLMRIAQEAGTRVAYVKPHGALYNAAMSDPELADAIARAVRACDSSLALMGAAGAAALSRWRAARLAVISEVFADRRYERDGSLRARHHPDALITDPIEAGAQAIEFVSQGRADSICVHSDTPGARDIAAHVRHALDAYKCRGQLPLSP